MSLKIFSKKSTIISNLIHEGMWPLLGNIAGIIINIFTIKLITSFIKTENYGIASLTIGICLLINSMIIGPLMVAHNRLFFDYSKRSLSNWYIKNFKRIIFKGIAIVCLIYLIISIIYNLEGNDSYLKYSIPILFLALVIPFFNELTNYLEAVRQQKKLALLNSIQKIFYPIFILILIYFSLNQIITIIFAQALSFFIVILLVNKFYNFTTKENLLIGNQIEERKYLNKEILSFGWSLPLGFMGMWLLTTSDRYILEHFRSANEVGVYVLNYGFWSMPFAIVNGWLEVWTRPHIYDNASKNEWVKLNNIIIKRFLLGAGLGILILMIIYFFSDIISSLFLSSNYVLESNVIYLIALAHLFFVLGYSILPMFLAVKKLKANLIAIFSAALVNILLNIYLIPAYGLLGAAFSTFIGYVIWVIILSIGALKLKNVLLTNYKLNEDNKN